MPWIFTSDVDEYAATVWPLLAQDPVRNTICLTVLDTLRRDPSALSSDQPKLLAWYVDSRAEGYARPGEARGAVLRTPPFELLLGVLPPGSANELVTDLRREGWPIPGVNGDVHLVDSFAAAWLDGEELTAKTSMRIRLYALGALLDPPRPPPGTARPAGPDDLDLAVRWFRAFQKDVGGHESDVAWAVRDRIEDGRMWIWEHDGVPTALAARQQTAVGVARIGPVYTPAAHRRMGYGTAVTAACTRAALENAEAVVLFTDLANPVSNSIYQQIGYRPVSDRSVVRFEPPQPAGQGQ